MVHNLDLMHCQGSGLQEVKGCFNLKPHTMGKISPFHHLAQVLHNDQWPQKEANKYGVMCSTKNNP
jgi:hypothetical protein